MRQAARASLALFVLAATPALAGELPAPEPRAVVPLKLLVRDAIEHNLGLAAARASARSVATGVRGAEGAFDPLLQLAPAYSQGRSTLLLEPGASTTGSQSSRFLTAGVAGTLPSSTSYSLDLDHAWYDQENPLIAADALQPSASTTLSLTLRQPLLRGAGSRYAGAPVDLARLASMSASERLERTLEQTIAAVESAYWSLGLYEAIERLSRESLRRNEELLSRNERMRSLGLIADVDLITSRRGVQARRTSLTEATRRRRDAAEQLLLFVYGEKADSMAGRVDALATEPPPDTPFGPPAPEDLDEMATSLRSDVRASQHDLERSVLSEKVARNALLPDLSLAGSLAAATQAADSFRLFSNARAGDLDRRDWRVGVTLSFPLSNREARAALERSGWDAQGSALALASTRANVRSEVRTAARAVEAGTLRLEQAQLSLDLARQQYEAGQKQLQLGLVDSFRLLQMEDDVTNAELVLAQVRYERAQAVTSWELATEALARKHGVAGTGEPGKP